MAQLAQLRLAPPQPMLDVERMAQAAASCIFNLTTTSALVDGQSVAAFEAVYRATSTSCGTECPRGATFLRRCDG
jgi:hypothetical protein